MPERTIWKVTAAGFGRSAIAVAGGVGLTAALALAVGGVRLDATRGPGFGPAQIVLGVLPLYALAVFLIRRRPDNRVSWYFLLAISTLTLAIAAEPLMTLALRALGPASWFWAANLVYQWILIASNVAIATVAALFPDGRAEQQWHDALLRGLWALLAVPPLLLLSQPRLVVDPLPLDPLLDLPSPVFLPWLAPLGQPLEAAFRGHYTVVLLGGLIFFRRYLRAGPDRRRPMRWFARSALLLTALVITHVIVQLVSGPGPALTFLGRLLVPVELAIALSLAVGVLRHRLFDIDVVIRRSVVYAGLTLGIAALYAAVAAVPGLVLARSIPVEVAVLLTIAAALAFQPARTRLTGLADRMVFGRRVDGMQQLLLLGSALEQTVDLRELLPKVAGTVQAGLGAPWVRVSLYDETGEWLLDPQGRAGTEPGDVLEPAAMTGLLERAGTVLGQIECGPRPDGYGERERELLDQLAAQAATAIANLRLTAQLARSRERLVQAADTERRRIERDIHDGAQQQVVALLAQVRLARNRVERGERDPETVLSELQDDIRQLSIDLRELAHGIHPPLLSDRGLLAAVQARADRLPIAVDVHATSGIADARFGADVEGACYFVICEALTNVVKHAQAHEIEIELSADARRLGVRVRDDGVGFGPNGSGRGLTGMRDRVEALGGRLDVGSALGRGTTVEAELPIGIPGA
jgi:signal transduction histidine kinase